MSDPKPTRWWHWVFLYPTLVASVLGAIPTLLTAYRSFKYDVPYTKVEEASSQQELWAKNIECLRNAVFTPTRNPNGVEISSVVCASGDVLLSGKRPGWSTAQYRWVAWGTVATDIDTNKVASEEYQYKDSDSNLHYAIWYPDNSHHSGFQKVQYNSVVVLCQAMVQPGIMRQRIATNQGCFDQYIDLYKGMVIQITPAQCNCY